MKRNLTQAMRLLVVALVIMLAFATLPPVAVSATPPEGTEAQGQPTRFRSIYVEHDATIAGNLTASGDFTLGDDLAITGDLKVGNGTPTVTQDGEDAYIEGQFEVDGEAQFDGAIDANSTVQIDGATTFGIDGTGVDVRFYSDTAGDSMLWDESEEALTITGTDGQDALNIPDGNLDVDDNSAFGDAAGDTTTLTGDMVLNGLADADAANYDYWFEITGDMTGTGTKDRNYGLLIDMTRPAGQELVVGDHDEAGLKIQVINKAVNTVAGNTLRGINVMAKNDNPSGSLTNLIGGLISIQTDTGSPPAGNVSVGKALEVNVTANAPITDTLMLADFRLFRQTATEPTQEYGVRIRNSSTTGTGADAALWIDSDGSGETDDWGYGIDMSGADIDTADIRLENGETISNGTDGQIDFSGAIGVTGDGIVINSLPFTYTDALTISGVLTNVRLLYYQVP